MTTQTINSMLNITKTYNSTTPSHDPTLVRPFVLWFFMSVFYMLRPTVFSPPIVNIFVSCYMFFLINHEHNFIEANTATKNWCSMAQTNDAILTESVGNTYQV